MLDGDTYVTAGPPAPHIGSLRVDCGYSKPWSVRIPGTQIRAPHPGSAVHFEGRLYEVERGGLGEDGRYFYDLAPWDDAFTVRQVFELSPETAKRELAEHRLQPQRERRAGVLGLLRPLTGLLAAADQRRLELEYSIPAAGSTAISALCLLSASTILIVVSLVSFGGRSLPGLAWAESYLPLWVFLFIESVLRAISGWKAGEPMGELFVVLPIGLVRSLARSPSQEQRETRGVEASMRSTGASRFLTACDEVLPGRGEDCALEIVSLLPKPHWTANQTGISYQGRWYVLTEREVVLDPPPPRHRFLLAFAPENPFFRSMCEYHPTEVRDVYRQQVKEKRSTWVSTLAPLWGLLEPSLQTRLQEVYGFDPLAAMRASVWLTGAVGLVGLASSVAILAGPEGGLADALVFAASLTLLGETVARGRHLGRGEIAGSVLGRVLRPFAESLLRV